MFLDLLLNACFQPLIIFYKVVCLRSASCICLWDLPARKVDDYFVLSLEFPFSKLRAIFLFFLSKYYQKCLVVFFIHFPACHKFLDNSIEIVKKNEKTSMVINYYVKFCLKSNHPFISILSRFSIGLFICLVIHDIFA